MSDRKKQLIEQRNAHQRRLDELEIQAAQLGYSTPPHIKTEIDEIGQTLSKLDASIAALDTYDDLKRDEVSNGYWSDRRSDDPRIHIMIATVQATVAEVANIKRFVTDQFTEQNRKLFRVGLLALLALAMYFALIMWLVS